jgi:hypothetical protein
VATVKATGTLARLLRNNPIAIRFGAKARYERWTELQLAAKEAGVISAAPGGDVFARSGVLVHHAEQAFVMPRDGFTTIPTFDEAAKELSLAPEEIAYMRDFLEVLRGGKLKR